MIARVCLLLALCVAAVSGARLPTRRELEALEAKELAQIKKHHADGATALPWSLAENATRQNMKPLIGIMTQPCHDCPGKSWLAAGFVKWLESAGARPVPIRFYASDGELARLFKSINGLVFPGGLTWLWLDAPYVIAARKLFNMAVEANDNGEVFPIHGTCLGFQLLHILVSNISRNDLLVDTNSTSHPTTLEWTDAADDSNMFRGMDASLRQKLASPDYNISLENHMYGLPPPFYKRWPILEEWYTALSTTVDRQGIEYISTMEGKNYPFFGTQWHPEKPPYEFGDNSVPHSMESIMVSQHLGHVFVDTARFSSHKPESLEEELAMVIYSYDATFSARFEVLDDDNYDGPDITYYFDKQEDGPHGPDDGDHYKNKLMIGRGPSRMADDGDDDPLAKQANSYAEYMTLRKASSSA
eukprot:gene27707-7350_t